MSGSAFASWAIGPTVVNSSQSLIKVSLSQVLPRINSFPATRMRRRCKDMFEDKNSQGDQRCSRSCGIEGVIMNLSSNFQGYTTQDLTIIKWGPRIDGDFFPSTPDVLVKNAPPKPVILGVSDKDSSFFSRLYLPYIATSIYSCDGKVCVHSVILSFE